jgi:hypothetical protein
MRKVIKCFIPLLLSCLVCCKPALKPAEYVRYVTSRDNGLKKAVEADGFEYDMQYRPHDYVVLMETKGQASAQSIKARLAELSGTAWFTISIRRSDNKVTPLRYGITSMEEYNSRLSYLLNEASNSIWLVYGSDTLHPKSYLFENNYNLTPYETMVVGFYLPEGDVSPTKNMQLSYDDRIFKNGIIRATYTEQSLKNIPNIILN